MPKLSVLHVLFSQEERIIPPKKETEDEKPTKLKKKRKVSVVTPAVAKWDNRCCADSCSMQCQFLMK